MRLQTSSTKECHLFLYQQSPKSCNCSARKSTCQRFKSSFPSRSPFICKRSEETVQGHCLLMRCRTNAFKSSATKNCAIQSARLSINEKIGIQVLCWIDEALSPAIQFKGGVRNLGHKKTTFCVMDYARDLIRNFCQLSIHLPCYKTTNYYFIISTFI